MVYEKSQLHKMSLRAAQSLNCQGEGEQSKQQDRSVKEGIMSITQWHSTGQASRGHREAAKVTRTDTGEHGATASSMSPSVDPSPGGSKESLGICSHGAPYGMQWRTVIKAQLLCSNRALLYRDGGGG